MSLSRTRLRIPMSSPDLTDAEREAVAEVLRTPNLSMGSRLQAFEEAFQSLTGASHAIGVSSGTAGLHLCVRASGIEEGDLVITTPFSFVASANAVLFERAVPIFVDVDPQTGNIDPAQVAEAARDLSEGGTATRRWLPRRGAREDAPLRALLPVDVFGQPADMDSLMAVAGAYDLRVIEDSCEALGAEYKGRPAGSLGHYGVFAFYPNKQITTGEGAVVITDDDRGAALIRALRNQGRAPGDTWLQHTYLGYNYRLDEMSAALGVVQLGRLEELLARRSRVAAWYQERLVEIPEVEVPRPEEHTSRMSWFVYVIRLPDEPLRDRVARELQVREIPSRPYFAPIHLQPYMVEQFGYRRGDFPITEALGGRSLALPFSSVMTEAQVDQVVGSLREILGP